MLLSCYQLDSIKAKGATQVAKLENLCSLSNKTHTVTSETKKKEKMTEIRTVGLGAISCTYSECGLGQFFFLFLRALLSALGSYRQHSAATVSNGNGSVQLGHRVCDSCEYS